MNAASSTTLPMRTGIDVHGWGVCEDKPIGELIHAYQECLAEIRGMPAHLPQP